MKTIVKVQILKCVTFVLNVLHQFKTLSQSIAIVIATTTFPCHLIYNFQLLIFHFHLRFFSERRGEKLQFNVCRKILVTCFGRLAVCFFSALPLVGQVLQPQFNFFSVRFSFAICIFL